MTKDEFIENVLESLDRYNDAEGSISAYDVIDDIANWAEKLVAVSA